MRTFRSPNAGQTSLTLQHSTSPASGYRPPAGHNADGYTMAQRVPMAKGGKAKLDDNFPEATLKRTEDLVKAAGIRDNFLAKIVSLLTGALAFLGTSGLMGKLTDMAMAFGRRGRGMKVGRGGMTSMQRLKQMRRSGRSVGGIKPSRFQMVKNAGMDKFDTMFKLRERQSEGKNWTAINTKQGLSIRHY